MAQERRVVVSGAELLAATQDERVGQIIVCGVLAGLPSVRLGPGQQLVGDGVSPTISFAPGIDGIQMTADNELRNLRLQVEPNRRAVFNDTHMPTLGHLVLAGLSVVGQVQILLRDDVRGGHVEVNGIDIVAADTRALPERPRGFGVAVLQGAFTLWNMQGDRGSVATAQLAGISVGREGKPVLGSGIFVAGAGEGGGRLLVSLLETGPVYSDGRIAPGTPDLITGGVFTVHGAEVKRVHNAGPVVTYGVNDMVLDNWGRVETWVAAGPLTSYGPSGIGFVNFGTVDSLTVEAPIETFGQGARGFNVYAGTVGQARFDRITTHADGAVGIQVSQPIGRLVVRRGIETFGGTGESLVKGVVTRLSAVGLSLKPGGSIKEVAVDGGITTHQQGIAPIEIEGCVGALRLEGGLYTHAA